MGRERISKFVQALAHNVSGSCRNVLSFISLLMFACASGQLSPNHTKFNHDEAKIPPYVEPQVLLMNDGRPLTSTTQWFTERRPEILQFLRSQMFGFGPSDHLGLSVSRITTAKNAFDGLATRKQISLVLPGNLTGPTLHILLYVPNKAKHRVPVFLGLNDAGNQSVSTDPGIDLNPVWLPSADDRSILAQRIADSGMRGSRASQWPVKTILSRGYGFATLYDGDLEPDFAGGINDGFRSVLKADEDRIAPDERWGAIGLWAWGLSRALDYLSSDKNVDGSRVAVVGHSRFGKAALWAGAQDQRFGMVISNESGKGGAALLKRDYGETIENLTTRFSYWFCPNFKKYAGKPEALPFDSPFILALVAPRPLYIASSDGEFIVDPKGEFLAARLVEPVYSLFGVAPSIPAEMPGINQPVGGQVGYHVRAGKHDMTAFDWQEYLAFADAHFGHQ